VTAQARKSTSGGRSIGEHQDDASILLPAEFDFAAWDDAKQVADRLWDRDLSP
jgi:hypothetical protein